MMISLTSLGACLRRFKSLIQLAKLRLKIVPINMSVLCSQSNLRKD